jgi:hypothetical protein
LSIFLNHDETQNDLADIQGIYELGKKRLSSDPITEERGNLIIQLQGDFNINYAEDQHKYYFNNDEIGATGILTNFGFKILKGSQFRENSKTFDEVLKSALELINTPYLHPTYIFIKDYMFANHKEALKKF